MKEENTYTINMVENHIRTLNVIDDDVLNVLKEIPRALFVPNQYKSFAHVDMKIPLGYGQYMLLPSVEAKILQSMSIKKSETVIVVGSGSGYLSACVSMLAHQVCSIDIIKAFVNQSIKNASILKNKNLSFENKNILNSFNLIQNYKTIIFTMAFNDIDPILANMDNNTRCFIFQAKDGCPVQKGVIIRKTNKSGYIKDFILETNVESIITEKI
tara:strand:- start:6 stop:647 length:642 start_codon:yes stop_codon:yes gene_type:complete